MDADDLFRKLTCGAKFNFKKYSSDAQKLKVCVFFVENPLPNLFSLNLFLSVLFLVILYTF